MVNRTEKTCRNIQHVKSGNIWEMSNLICGKAAVGGNYNLTHDSEMHIKIMSRKSYNEAIFRTQYG